MRDVIVIGGGTSGLYAAYYSRMRNLDTLVLEYQEETGGKAKVFYPEKELYDVPGFVGITGEDFVYETQKQTELLSPEIETGVVVTGIEETEDGVTVMTDKGDYQTSTVILASGLGAYDMVPLPLEKRKEFEPFSIHYTLENRSHFKNKRVAVYSNFRIGIDWALTLENTGAAEVYLINRDETFRAVYEHDEEQLAASSVHVLRHTDIVDLEGEAGALSHLHLSDGSSIEVDHLLVYEGVNIGKSVYKDWGLEVEKGRVTVDTEMRTSMDRVFACGDSAYYPGKAMLLASGMSEAMTAVNSVKQLLVPKAPPQIYSTVVYKHEKPGGGDHQ
ncbi:NAD(P)/FAD-dependent oxidoreductase [Salimicrobium flavidum]|uniref:Ferredoxin--NADP reductase n=1 Tax=Salimicrobium flavidum TaxID=570947 RepID=A0A1N7K8H5_9BACI|nr:NAD(P)/FAD-dependent oxidoreductase [Salimicrobium flavidum]SIS57871.1 thioredoxin reductase (NADPH) [Salimicrobium flavidum]